MPATRLFGAAEVYCEAQGNPVPLVEPESYERGVALARSGLGEEEFAAEWAEGRALSLEQAVAFALTEDG